MKPFFLSSLFESWIEFGLFNENLMTSIKKIKIYSNDIYI
jgi:hypothetical protein